MIHYYLFLYVYTSEHIYVMLCKSFKSIHDFEYETDSEVHYQDLVREPVKKKKNVENSTFF